MILSTLSPLVPGALTVTDKIYAYKNGIVGYYTSVFGVGTFTQSAILPDGDKYILCTFYISPGHLIIGCGSGAIYHFDGTTLTKVLQYAKGYPMRWSCTHYGTTVFLAEYGTKDNADNPRRVYKSSDSGVTWAEVLELDSGTGIHLHKVLYDHYTDTLWIAQGDPPNTKLWKADGPLHTTAEYVAAYQPTAGIVTADYILWGMDSVPCGVVRYNKATEAFDMPLALADTAYDDFIFDMCIDADGYIYACTVRDKTTTAVILRGTPPTYTEWVVVWDNDEAGIYEIMNVGTDILAKLEYGTAFYGAAIKPEYTVSDRLIRTEV